MKLIEKNLYQLKKSGQKTLAILIDPDESDVKLITQIVEKLKKIKNLIFLVGGSLLIYNKMEETINYIKQLTDKPVIIFPNNPMQIYPNADGILFLSLISGRNPEMLIGHHVLAAPILSQTNLEVLPTGYILIDSGQQTTVSYMSGTTPIPHNKPDIAVATAMAGEYLGLRLLFMDAGSGAIQKINPKMIEQVSKHTKIPLIIGGGIRSKQEFETAFNNGADIVVIGNVIEKNPDFLDELSVMA